MPEALNNEKISIGSKFMPVAQTECGKIIQRTRAAEKGPDTVDANGWIPHCETNWRNYHARKKLKDLTRSASLS